jgi:uncharacterized protein
MMRLLRLFLALIGFMLIGASPLSAQTFPKFTGLVVDDANVLPANVKADLIAKLQALQKDTNRQVVVATIGDMQGYPLDEYGYKLGRAWGVGLKNANNGAIILVAPNNSSGQRGPRIEVGRGLEPILTDALTSQIINTQMMPRLANGGDVPGALTAGTDAVVAQLRASPEEAKAKVDAAVAAFNKARPHAGQRSGGGGFPLGIVFVVLVIGFVGLSFVRRRSGSGQRYSGDGHGSSGVLPVILWSIANEIGNSAMRGSGSSWGGGGGDNDGGGGGWGGGGFSGGGGGDFGGGGASGSW